MNGKILPTKLYVPPPPEKLLRRTRLFNKLQAGRGRKLVIISAPAGYGKTTLITSWLRQFVQEQQTPAPTIGWLSLDEDDNQLRRFFASVAAALQPGLAVPSALEVQLALPEPVNGRSLSLALIEDVTAVSHPLYLILDDYHVITQTEIHEALAYLLDRLPPHFHLLLTSRTDPPLPVARWRVRGQLTEIRAADLRFTLAETAEFLHSTLPHSLSPDDIATLENRTEGWAAGVQLAALSLKNSPDTASAHIRALDGRHGYIFDYLMAEVLQQQPAEVRTFLAGTAVLNHLSAPLCTALLDGAFTEQQAQQMLAQLYRDNLFLIPLDAQGQWFRYHPLFADFLRHRLRQHTPQRPPQLHQRAASWYAQNGRLADAIHHALAGELHDLAADLIGQGNEALFQRGELALILHRLAALPPDIIHKRLDLCLNYAWVLTLIGRYDDVEPLLQTAESLLSQQGATFSPTTQHSVQGNIANIRAYVAYAHDDMPTTRTQALTARAILPEALADQRTVAALHLGTAHLEKGNLAEAAAALQEAVQISQQADHPYLTLRAYNGLAWLHIVQGGLPQAAATYQQALYLVEQYAQRGERLLAEAIFWGLCQIHYAWNELETAESYLVRSRETAVMASQTHWHPHILWMQLHQAQGNLDIAAASLARAEAEAVAVGTPLAQISLLAWQAWWQQRQSDLAVAARTIGMAETLLQQPANQSAAFRHLQELVATVQADIMIQSGAASEAVVKLEQLRQTAVQYGRLSTVCHTHLLQALGHHAVGDASLAQEHFAQAVKLAEPGGNLRLFLDAGAEIGTLLFGVTAASPFLEKIKVAFGPTRRQTEADAAPSELTRRERDTLRLLATDRTIPEIAEVLVVSVSTVRTYCKRIYGKLGVHSRAEAVYLARSLNLL